MPVENLSGGHELHGHVWKLYLRRTHRQADEKKKKTHTLHSSVLITSTQSPKKRHDVV